MWSQPFPALGGGARSLSGSDTWGQSGIGADGLKMCPDVSVKPPAEQTLAAVTVPRVCPTTPVDEVEFEMIAQFGAFTLLAEVA